MRLERIIYLDPGKLHFIVVAITANKLNAHVGEDVGIHVAVSNTGNQADHENLTVTYQFQGTKTIGQNPDFLLTSGKNFEAQYVLHTTDLTPQAYQITAHAAILNPNRTDTQSVWSADDSVSFTLQGNQAAGIPVTTLAIGGVIALAAVIGVVQLVRRRRKTDDTIA
jgi:hypothetical protein